MMPFQLQPGLFHQHSWSQLGSRSLVVRRNSWAKNDHCYDEDLKLAGAWEGANELGVSELPPTFLTPWQETSHLFSRLRMASY